MTKDQDDGDTPPPDLPTFAEAIEQRKQFIAKSREGDKKNRRLADIISKCRKGNRCNLDECPVCDRRNNRALSRISSAVGLITGSFTFSFSVYHILLSKIKVSGGRRPLNEEKVRALEASMKKIGLRTPITVREQGKQVILVSGLHRLAAAQRLEWTAIPCFIIYKGKIEARLWQLMENFYRAELTALERAEHIDELRVLILQKPGVGQDAPPGGCQPKDIGINKTAKALGVTKEEVRRAKNIARIAQKAKVEARKLGLDNNQDALLAIAKLPTPAGQVMAVEKIVERKRAARARYASAVAVGNAKMAAEIKTIEANITEKMDNVESLNDELVAERERLREIQDELVADCVDTTPIDEPNSIVPDDDADKWACAIDDDGRLERMKARWEKYLAPDWKDASEETQKRFMIDVVDYHQRVQHRSLSTTEI